MSDTRGEYRSPARGGQLLLFKGLRWGKITPTDFDLFIDFGGRGFVLGEIKYRDAAVPFGQRLAIERAASAWSLGGIRVLAMIAGHDTETGDVIVADAIVRETWRCRGAGPAHWMPMLTVTTVAALIERFHAHITGLAHADDCPTLTGETR